MSLDRQGVATLVATGLEDRATRPGAHAGTEAVRLGTLPLVWLISTLQENLIRIRQLTMSLASPLGAVAKT